MNKGSDKSIVNNQSSTRCDSITSHVSMCIKVEFDDAKN